MSKRQHISLTTKLAAALLARGEIDYKHAKHMHEDQIVSLYEFHHNKRHAEDGGNHFSNLAPMLRAEHRERTAKIDIPQIAKGKRLRDNLAAFNARMAAKDAGVRQPQGKSRWPKRKLQSRGFQR